MVRIILILSCLALAPAAGAQSVPPRITLDEAVTLALRENRTLRAKEFENQATRAQEITAGLRPNPVATSFTNISALSERPRFGTAPRTLTVRVSRSTESLM